MKVLPKAELKELRAKYPIGARVSLMLMNDPYAHKLSTGEQGTVIRVDDIGTIHVHWDCGSSLGLAYGEDRCELVDECSEFA